MVSAAKETEKLFRDSSSASGAFCLTPTETSIAYPQKNLKYFLQYPSYGRRLSCKFLPFPSGSAARIACLPAGISSCLNGSPAAATSESISRESALPPRGRFFFFAVCEALTTEKRTFPFAAGSAGEASKESLSCSLSLKSVSAEKSAFRKSPLSAFSVVNTFSPIPVPIPKRRRLLREGKRIPPFSSTRFSYHAEGTVFFKPCILDLKSSSLWHLPMCTMKFL